MWTDEKADAINIIEALPKMFGDDDDYVSFANWMFIFGRRREPSMTPDDVRKALEFIDKMVRHGRLEQS